MPGCGTSRGRLVMVFSSLAASCCPIAGKLIHWINFWPSSDAENPLIPAVQVSGATSGHAKGRPSLANPFDAFGTDLSHRTARRIWTAFGLQPHRSETFRPSADPPFVDKLQDIGGLYPSPPNRAIYGWMRIQTHAPDREQPVLPRGRHGRAEGPAFVRKGTMSLFAALDIATGAVIGKCYRSHRPTEFLDILKQIDRQMPEGQTCLS